MVKTCVVWGCTNRAGVGDSTIKFYDIPKVITHQGKQTEELSSERRVLWLSQINRANFNPDPNKRHFKVCSDHFISGMNICIFKKTASYVCYRNIDNPCTHVIFICVIIWRTGYWCMTTTNTMMTG
jgi:hypothetical protein